MSSTLLNRKIEYWEHQLLDLGKRNRMINYRETKRTTLKLIEPSFEELFQRLAIDEETLTFQRSVDRETDIRVFSILSLLENLSSPLPVTIGDIKTEGSILDRQKTLKNIRSKARLSLEEQGTNIENSVDEHVPLNHIHIEDETKSGEVRQIDSTALKSIHKASDDTIDWTEVLVSPVAPDDMYNQEMWSYYHSVANKVLSGDIDTYLQLIYEVNPLDDLLSYGGNFEFGTDDPQKIEVEFTINEAALPDLLNQMDRSAYNDLMQDYVCSVCIRIARDMFALLPISHTIVHSVLDGKTVVSVDFDRASLSKVKFGYIDPSEILSKFRHNMRFRVDTGFSSVPMID